MAMGVTRTAGETAIAQLRHGARMDQQTFHRLYEQVPENLKAELIEGTVHIAAAMRVPHAEHADLLRTWLTIYRFNTPGVRGGSEATVILGEGSEAQPDGLLWIEGGNARIDGNDYLRGAPEFVAEVSDTTASTDLGPKRNDFERYGVAEYLVLLLRKRETIWFSRDSDGRYAEMPLNSDGLLKSRVFPGLWLDAEAFLRLDGNQVLEVLRQGIASSEHVAFVKSREKST